MEILDSLREDVVFGTVESIFAVGVWQHETVMANIQTTGSDKNVATLLSCSVLMLTADEGF
jgi:hypothetical protein